MRRPPPPRGNPVVTLVTPEPYRGARTGRKEGVRACRCWQSRKTSCTMAPVLKGLASWHDEAPKGLRFLGRNLVEPLDRVAPDGQSLQRGPGRLLRCQMGAPGEATANRFAARRPGGGRPGWVPPQQDLRHPVPLSRGAARGVSRFRQHEHPVEGPATEVAEPTAGCSVCACGYGYPEHVATSCLIGVSGRPKNPHHKVLWPEWPLTVAKPVDGATLILIYATRHPIAPGRCARRLGTTCRIPGAP